MKKIISGVSLAALMAIGALATIAPASANPAQDKVISGYCNNEPDATDCNEWRSNRASWTDQQYQQFYSAHASDSAFSTPDASAAFSMAGGTTLPPPDPNAAATETRVIPGYTDASKVYTVDPNAPVVSTSTGDVVKTVPEVQGDSPTHIQDCQATFKSYDAATDTYMGLDGSREKCKL
jgi:BA14K-like protein